MYLGTDRSSFLGIVRSQFSQAVQGHVDIFTMSGLYVSMRLYRSLGSFSHMNRGMMPDMVFEFSLRRLYQSLLPSTAMTFNAPFWRK